MSDQSSPQQYTLVALQDLQALTEEIRQLRADFNRMKFMPRSNWMKLADAASHYGVSVDTIKRRIATGQLEARNDGKLREVFVGDQQ